MNKLSKDVVLKIIKTIDKKLYRITKDYQQHLIYDDTYQEFVNTSNALTELKTEIQSFIEIEESLTEE